MRVLIVEDEVRLAETLRDLLELERYTADICHDGESGLDNALSDIYDLVILDVMLPKKDGFSVLRALRQAGKTVSEIFARNGEEVFRDMETRLCEELSRREGLIVATGGGLPLREENRELLKGSGLVLFLNRAPADIFDTGDMSKRPLGQQGRAAFLERFEKRLPLYRACAHGEISDFSSVERTLTEILQYVEGAQ